ncbi:MAG: hypothetical protein E2P02_30560 [Acidobacteria bacterium]|nr:MAG: hypothetical protein E2P02_30560 [Acidobacteriota bacterium]
MERTTILIIAMFLMAPPAFSRDESGNNDGALEIHRCSNNPFTRSVGFFSGRQPEIFLKAPHTRNGPPPQTDELTRVMHVTKRKSLSNPTAVPVIDKCGSGLHWDEREGLVKLTVLWDERNCTVFSTPDEPPHCRTRAVFGFSLDELGIHEFSSTKQARKALESRLERDFVADVYFSQQIRPRVRQETGLWTPTAAEVHLVARIIPLRKDSTRVDYQLMRKPVVQAIPE